MCWMGEGSGINSRQRQEDFFPQSIETDSGTHLASHLKWTGSACSGDNIDHSPPPSVTLKFHHVFMVWYLIRFWVNFAFIFCQWWLSYIFMMKLSLFQFEDLVLNHNGNVCFCTNILKIMCFFLTLYHAWCTVFLFILWQDAEQRSQKGRSWLGTGTVNTFLQKQIHHNNRRIAGSYVFCKCCELYGKWEWLNKIMRNTCTKL
jgi:hypothetical protein